MAGAGVTGRYSIREEECRSRRCLGVSNASTTSSKEEAYDGTSAWHYSPVLGRGATTSYYTISTKCSEHQLRNYRCPGCPIGAGLHICSTPRRSVSIATPFPGIIVTFFAKTLSVKSAKMGFRHTMDYREF
jgi:hypothetical protein